MASLNKLNFITGNKNKLAEVRTILGSIINVKNQSVDVPEIQGTIEEIAKEKCRRAAEVVSSKPIGIYDSVFCYEPYYVSIPVAYDRSRSGVPS